MFSIFFLYSPKTTWDNLHTFLNQHIDLGPAGRPGPWGSLEEPLRQRSRSFSSKLRWRRTSGSRRHPTSGATWGWKFWKSSFPSNQLHLDEIMNPTSENMWQIIYDVIFPSVLGLGGLDLLQPIGRLPLAAKVHVSQPHQLVSGGDHMLARSDHGCLNHTESWHLQLIYLVDVWKNSRPNYLSFAAHVWGPPMPGCCWTCQAVPAAPRSGSQKSPWPSPQEPHRGGKPDCTLVLKTWETLGNQIGTCSLTTCTRLSLHRCPMWPRSPVKAGAPTTEVLWCKGPWERATAWEVHPTNRPLESDMNRPVPTVLQYQLTSRWIPKSCNWELLS